MSWRGHGSFSNGGPSVGTWKNESQRLNICHGHHVGGQNSRSTTLRWLPIEIQTRLGVLFVEGTPSWWCQWETREPGAILAVPKKRRAHFENRPPPFRQESQSSGFPRASQTASARLPRQRAQLAQSPQAAGEETLRGGRKHLTSGKTTTNMGEATPFESCSWILGWWFFEYKHKTASTWQAGPKTRRAGRLPKLPCILAHIWGFTSGGSLF